MQHQVVRDNYYKDPEKLKDPEEFEVLQEHLAQTIAKIFGNQFSADQLLDGLDMKNRSMIEDILLLALGGRIDEKGTEKDEKSSKPNRGAAITKKDHAVIVAKRL